MSGQQRRLLLYVPALLPRYARTHSAHPSSGIVVPPTVADPGYGMAAAVIILPTGIIPATGIIIPITIPRAMAYLPGRHIPMGRRLIGRPQTIRLAAVPRLHRT